MLNKIFNRTKKMLLLSTVSVFTLFAVSNIYASPSNETAYMLQGASKTTMTDLVEQVGGEVIHDFSIINAISVSLTEEQAAELNTINPLVRLSSKSKTIETAGFVWPIRTKKGEKLAGFVWPIRTKKGEKFAGFVWPIRTKKGEKLIESVAPIRDNNLETLFV
jgi:hypothetical protein